MEAGWLTFGFSFTHGQRDRFQSGDAREPNPAGAWTEARVMQLEAGIGFWRDLSVRLGLPVLDAAYGEEGTRQRDTNLGDLWLRVGYAGRWAVGLGRHVLRLGGELGASFPTGGHLATELQSNAGFASQTVNPLLRLDLSFDLRSGFGTFFAADARVVPYGAPQRMDHGGVETTHVVRSGSAVTYGMGIRYRFLGSLVPSVGIHALHRLPDSMAGATVGDSGIHALYVAAGLAYTVRRGPLTGLAFHASVLVPVFQYAYGSQLVETVNVTVGLRYSVQAWNRQRPEPAMPVVADAGSAGSSTGQLP